jgi:transketolase
MAKTNRELDLQAVNQARGLAIDQVQKANSGHPGAPLGATPMVYELWAEHMTFSPDWGKWPNRDRFILSAGHASAMLYSLSYLFGFDYTLDDLKNFRQLGSRTPGHPDLDPARGVEMTTGPLGQGLATAVGMAMGERHLASLFNTEEYPLFNYYTYVYAGDGCLMEGISSEASSLAGYLGLGHLIVLYDSNEITIDGRTSQAWRENVGERYEAYGWDYHLVKDGNDLDEISKAIEKAKKVTDKPSLIEVKTKIGFASPLADTSKSHGAPLGEENVQKTKEALGLDPDKHFYVSDEVLTYTRKLQDQGREKAKAWMKMAEAYIKEDTEKSRLLENYLDGSAPYLANVEGFLDYPEKADATRNLSNVFLNRWSEADPLLIGGSADLAGSNKTTLKNSSFINPDDFSGPNIHFGVREHAMGAIANGLTLSGLHSYCATFMVFSDYMRHTLRMAALMEIPTVFVFTHDSIGVGEDGETHQPIEHYAALRAIPRLNFWRPADAKELAAAYAAWDTAGPTVLSLTRQSLPVLENSSFEKASKGAYVLEEANVQNGQPDLILMATGSEVGLALDVFKALAAKGRSVRLVSMPCWEIFEEQDEAYKEEVLPKAVSKRVSIEAGVAFGWERYVGLDGLSISLEDFGTSGPANEVFEHFGFTGDKILARIEEEIL